MSFSETVQTKDGRSKQVIAGSEAELKEAVAAAKADQAPVYPNINVPVEKGHDLVTTSSDLDTVLTDGTGAHNSPNNAVNPFSGETDSDVKVAGADEPAYKSVPVSDNGAASLVQPKEAEVKAARKESKPASEVR